MMAAKETLAYLDLTETYRETKQMLARAPIRMESLSVRSEDLSVMSDEEESSSEHTERKTVSFGGLHVRRYTVTIGDHPCCSTGFPLTLDWDYTDGTSLPIDQYERSRSPRRTREQLKISPEQRCQILSEEGKPSTELRRAQRKLHRARSCSAKLCERQNASFFQEC